MAKERTTQEAVEKILSACQTIEDDYTRLTAVCEFLAEEIDRLGAQFAAIKDGAKPAKAQPKQ